MLARIWRRGGIILLLFPQLFRSSLSSALQSLLWTSKVPKKSNISNKSGFLFWVYFHCRGLECGKSSGNFPGVADRIASLGTLPGPSTLARPSGHTRTNHGVIEYPSHLACKEGVTAAIPTTFTKGILKRGSRLTVPSPPRMHLNF
jgi:hypothetical protein